MKVVVFGASGKVGQVVVAQLLRQEHTVTAFVHANNPFQGLDSLTVVQGDIHDSAAVEQAVKGAEAIICTLGSWGTKQKDIVSEGMKAILPAMKSQGVQRIITLTGTAAKTSADTVSVSSSIPRGLLKLVAPAIVNDSEEHIRLLENSDRIWTVIRSPRMRSKGSFGKYIVSLKSPKPWKTAHRQDVAAAMIDQLTNDKFCNQAPYLSG